MNYSKIIEDTLNESIVGQEPHKLALSNMLGANVKSQTEVPGIMITGERGSGKTNIARTIIYTIQKLYPDETIILPACESDALDKLPTPNGIRGESGDQSKFRSFMNDLSVALSGDHRCVIVFDECHEMGKGPNFTPNTFKRLFDLLMTIGIYSRESRCGSIVIEDNHYTWNPAKHFLLMATNYPEKVNPALASRFRQLVIGALSPEELQAILMRKLVVHGLRANEDTIKPIVNLCRTSARDLDDLLSELHSVAGNQGKKTLNKSDVITAMRGLQKFPFGFVKDFVKLLEDLTNNTYNGATLNAIYGANIPNLGHELGFAYGKKFVYRTAHGWGATDKCKAALVQWKQDGFKW